MKGSGFVRRPFSEGTHNPEISDVIKVVNALLAEHGDVRIRYRRKKTDDVHDGYELFAEEQDLG